MRKELIKGKTKNFFITYPPLSEISGTSLFMIRSPRAGERGEERQVKSLAKERALTKMFAEGTPPRGSAATPSDPRGRCSHPQRPPAATSATVVTINPAGALFNLQPLTGSRTDVARKRKRVASAKRGLSSAAARRKNYISGAPCIMYADAADATSITYTFVCIRDHNREEIGKGRGIVGNHPPCSRWIRARKKRSAKCQIDREKKN